MNICFAAAPFPRALILTRRLVRRRQKQREWRKFRKSPFWGMNFGLKDDEAGVITQSIAKEGDTFSYNGTVGIVIESRVFNPPNEFPKSSIKVEMNT